HRGHRELLGHLDPGMNRTVLTFDPHPVEVLRPGTPPRLLTTIEERVALLDELGVETVGVLDLSEIKDLAAEDFVRDVLVAGLGVGHLVVGEDFRFGRDRTGDVGLLARLGAELDFRVETIGLVAMDGQPVSSSRIRALVEAGDVAAAGDLLGSWFRMENEVVHGDERGRVLGFPTANLRPPGRKVVPANGVYSCFAVVDGHRHDAAVNVGVRPTFGGGELLVEAHLLDFDGDLYGHRLELEFVGYTRPELSFSSVEELVARMGEDVALTREVLAGARSRM
ncbi:MAG TPA: riboflavin biosynthesis protein RibF, partial [Acidimicrobiia bacterium]|nr:riboflavin biosynthesis protein RibF [Acidimicrobiia bacterium]